MSCLPLIGVTVCTKQSGSHSYPSVAAKSVRAFMVSDARLLRLTLGMCRTAAHDTLSVIKAAIAASAPLITPSSISQAVNAAVGARRFARGAQRYSATKFAATRNDSDSLRVSRSLSQAHESTLSLAVLAGLSFPTPRGLYD